MKIFGGFLFALGMVWALIGEYFLLVTIWPVAKYIGGLMLGLDSRLIFNPRSYRFDYQLPMTNFAWGWSLLGLGLLGEGFGYKLFTKRTALGRNRVLQNRVNAHGPISAEIEETVASIEKFLGISRSRMDR